MPHTITIISVFDSVANTGYGDNLGLFLAASLRIENSTQNYPRRPVSGDSPLPAVFGAPVRRLESDEIRTTRVGKSILGERHGEEKTKILTQRRQRR
jgi:hypothetical protein